MIQTIRLSLMAVLICQISVVSPAALANNESRIVGGTPVKRGSYPWMAAIVDGGTRDTFQGHICGGSLVHKDYVLTASHCVTNFLGVPGNLEKNPIDVVMGIRRLGAANGERLAVEKIAAHPQYDIALLKLKSSATTTPVEVLAPGTRLADPRTMATVTGWGVTSEYGNSSRWLREVTVPIVSTPVCKRAYTYHDQVGEICAGFNQGGKDACQGDSGGPLFVAQRNGGHIQVGVVSYGQGCARRGFPGVYARVSAVHNWIDETIANDGELTPAPDYNIAVASLIPNLSIRCEGLECTFDARKSTPASDILRYRWRTENKSVSSGRVYKHSYAVAGTYTMQLSLVPKDSGARKITTIRQFDVDDSGKVTLLRGGPLTYEWYGNLQSDGRVVVPNQNGFRTTAGEINMSLTHGRQRDFDLYLQQLNETTSRWTVVANSKTIGTARERITSLPIVAGRYRIIVTNRRGEGLFRLFSTQR